MMAIYGHKQKLRRSNGCQLDMLPSFPFSRPMQTSSSSCCCWTCSCAGAAAELHRQRSFCSCYLMSQEVKATKTGEQLCAISVFCASPVAIRTVRHPAEDTVGNLDVWVCGCPGMRTVEGAVGVCARVGLWLPRDAYS
jgi:hypothetical protein